MCLLSGCVLKTVLPPYLSPSPHQEISRCTVRHTHAFRMLMSLLLSHHASAFRHVHWLSVIPRTQAGYDEDVRPSNVRLTIGFAAIAIALYAQFGTGKFPRNWWPLAGCVAAYVLLTGLLNLYAHFTDRDVFFVSRPQPGSGLRLKASARMERYGEMYRLRFAALLPGSQPPGAAAAQRNGAAGIGKGASGAAGDAKAAVDVSFDASVAKFFHEDGYFAEAAFRKVVEGLILEFEAAAASGQSAKSE